jgi:hypothetical protein
MAHALLTVSLDPYLRAELVRQAKAQGRNGEPRPLSHCVSDVLVAGLEKLTGRSPLPAPEVDWNDALSEK